MAGANNDDDGHPINNSLLRLWLINSGVKMPAERGTPSARARLEGDFDGDLPAKVTGRCC